MWQVGVGGTIRSTEAHMHALAYTPREGANEVAMPSVEVLTLEPQMSRCGGKGQWRRFWETQADSFVWIHYIQGKRKLFLFFVLLQTGSVIHTVKRRSGNVFFTLRDTPI